MFSLASWAANIGGQASSHSPCDLPFTNISTDKCTVTAVLRRSLPPSDYQSSCRFCPAPQPALGKTSLRYLRGSTYSINGFIRILTVSLLHGPMSLCQDYRAGVAKTFLISHPSGLHHGTYLLNDNPLPDCSLVGKIPALNTHN